MVWWPPNLFIHSNSKGIPDGKRCKKSQWQCISYIYICYFWANLVNKKSKTSLLINSFYDSQILCAPTALYINPIAETSCSFKITPVIIEGWTKVKNVPLLTYPTQAWSTNHHNHPASLGWICQRWMLQDLPRTKNAQTKPSWWFQPIWKMCSSKWVHLPQVSGWK